MNICPQHRKELKEIEVLQSLDKRLRDICNGRNPKPRHILKELNATIRDRKLFLWQALIRCHDKDDACGFCSFIKQLAGVCMRDSWYDRICLASSTAERLLRKQGVGGSNPPRGSILIKTTQKTVRIANAS